MMKQQIWALIHSKSPTNIQLAISLAKSQSIDIGEAAFCTLYNQLYPTKIHISNEKKLLKMLLLEELELSESPPQNIQQLPNLNTLKINARHSYQMNLSPILKSSIIKNLHLEGLSVSGIGKGFHQMTALNKLIFKSSKINYLHSDICKLSNLRTLSFRDTNLQQLPNQLHQLPLLKTLICINNNLTISNFNIIAQIKTLRILKIRESSFKKTEKEYLQKALPSLKVLLV